MSDRESRRFRFDSLERRHSRYRDHSSDGKLRRKMDAMMTRLKTLEEKTAVAPDRRRDTPSRSPPARCRRQVSPCALSRSRQRETTRAQSCLRHQTVSSPSRPTGSSPANHRGRRLELRSGTPPLLPPTPPPSVVRASRAVEYATEHVASEADASLIGQNMVTDRIVDAIRSINTAAQATGKLDSGMRGPYRVVTVLPHGRYEVQLLAGSYGKSTQAAAEYMIPWRGEWTPEVCAAYFDEKRREKESVGISLTPCLFSFTY